MRRSTVQNPVPALAVTPLHAPGSAVATSSGAGSGRYTLAPRSIVVLQRIGA